VYELSHSDTPPRVAIDEAIELAKKFGNANSPQFVNGILDRMIPGGRGAMAEAAAETVAPETVEAETVIKVSVAASETEASDPTRPDDDDDE
jgi:hypothetical protein